MIDSKAPARTLRVLLVEDQPAELWTLTKVLSKSDAVHRLHSIGDPREAISYLSRTGVYRKAPAVDIVLLSAELGDHALEIVTAVRSDARTHALPIIVITDTEEGGTTVAGRLRRATGPERVQGFITRPVTLEGWTNLLERLGSFDLGDECAAQLQTDT